MRRFPSTTQAVAKPNLMINVLKALAFGSRSDCKDSRESPMEEFHLQCLKLNDQKQAVTKMKNLKSVIHSNSIDIISSQFTTGINLHIMLCKQQFKQYQTTYTTHDKPYPLINFQFPSPNHKLQFDTIIPPIVEQLSMKKVHLVDEDIKDQRKVIVVLEKASLEVAAVRKHQNVLLNGDDHANYITNRLKKDPADYRPDITHQCLLTLLDSPLNKAGKLQVYITTATNQVIKIHPSTRIPRTYKRFAALFAQLLKRLSIRAEESSETLLQVIKSPVKQHLPPDATFIAMEVKGRMVNTRKFVSQLNTAKPVVLVVGAVAKGNPTMDVDYIQDVVCISKYALSASVCLSRLTNAFEDLFEIE